MGKRWTEEEQKQLKELYDSNLYTYEEIANKLGRTKSAINLKCSRYKLINKEISAQMTSKSLHTYSCNDKFFESPNPLCSYWAGFLAADGNIHKTKNLITLGLKTSDKIQLKKFKEDINFSGPVIDYKIKRKNKIQELSVVRISSYQIKRDLCTHYNITPNKSLILTPPVNLDDENTLAFIVGLIDGDGSIYRKKYKYGDYYALNLVGTYDICKYFKNNIENWLNFKKGPKISKKKNVFCIEYGGRKNTKLIFNKLKSIELPRLDRKWNNV